MPSASMGIGAGQTGFLDPQGARNAGLAAPAPADAVVQSAPERPFRIGPSESAPPPIAKSGRSPIRRLRASPDTRSQVAAHSRRGSTMARGSTYLRSALIVLL